MIQSISMDNYDDNWPIEDNPSVGHFKMKFGPIKSGKIRNVIMLNVGQHAHAVFEVTSECTTSFRPIKRLNLFCIVG